MFLCSADRLVIRKMENIAEDKALLLKWLTNPTVLSAVYGEDAPWDMAKIDRSFAEKTLENGSAVACIIEYDGRPIGYVQYYPVTPSSYRFNPDVPYERFAGGFGMDIFIGEPELWGRGIGTNAVKALVGYLFTALGAASVCADPEENNQRSVRCWAKAGFRPAGKLEHYDDPDKSSVLMAVFK